MIERMKKIIVVAPSARKVDMLNAIRDFGVVHISQKSAPESKYTEKLSSLDKIRSVLNEQPKVAQNPVLGKKEFDSLNERLGSAVSSIKPLEDELFALSNEKARISAWGSLNPQDVRALAEQGLQLSFYQLSNKEIAQLPEDVKYIRLADLDKMKTIAVVGQPLSESFPATKMELPARGLEELEAEISRVSLALHEAKTLIASSAAYISSYDHFMLKTTDDIMYSSISGGVEQEDNLCCLTGFIPETDLEGFKALAKDNCWAYAFDDPTDDDPVPTKIKYNKVTQMMEPVFQMLGTTPGYNEYDISMWFLLFFALFFAMIIGDAVYGLVFIAIAAVIQIKTKKLTNLTMLIYVMGGATLVWGALTGTWLGSEKAMEIPFLKMLVIPNIANYPEYFGVSADDAQNTVMKFSFMIGTIQLSLACLMNFVRNFKQKSLAFVSDLATLASTVSLYFLILMLVVGADVNVGLIFGIIGVSFVLVVLFGSQEAGQSFASGVKAGLGGAFTTFLNTISSFGNVMSYIRLFAVGMASLAIAQSFNGMADSLLHGFALPAGLLILIIGHGLNLVMGLLSVVVHGMRLNLLEFSGQLGMEWAGIPYEPFKKNA
jgi:V/A-type H+/Na+-transporting ATPase subunit I